MSDLTIHQTTLPVELQKDLDFHRGQMTRIAKLAFQALDEGSNVYSYDVYKTITSLSAANIWKKAAEENGLSGEEIEEWFRKTTENYMNQMAQIPQVSWEIILQIMKNTYSDHMAEGESGK